MDPSSDKADGGFEARSHPALVHPRKWIDRDMSGQAQEFSKELDSFRRQLSGGHAGKFLVQGMRTVSGDHWGRPGLIMESHGSRLRFFGSPAGLV